MKYLKKNPKIKPDSFNFFGWGTEHHTEQKRHLHEQRALDAFAARNFAKLGNFDQSKPVPKIESKLKKFIKNKGFEEGSTVLSFMDEFTGQGNFGYHPQKTGSCTISNTFPWYVMRAIYQQVVCGELSEQLGSTEFGTTSSAFYAPIPYGIARELGGLKGGDGGFCRETLQALTMGVIPCDNGKLNEVLTKLGATKKSDYPEPQSNTVYRRFQNWTYNNLFKPFLQNPIVGTDPVKSTDQLDAKLSQYKPVQHCSMMAVKKIGKDPTNGMTIYGPDLSNKWAHSMTWVDKLIVGSKTYYCLANTSWAPNLIYPMEANVVDGIWKRYKPDSGSIEGIKLTKSKIAA